MLYSSDMYSKEEKVYKCLQGYIDEVTVPAYKDLIDMYDSNPIIRTLIEKYVKSMHNTDYFRLKFLKTGEETSKNSYDFEKERYNHYRDVFWECVVSNY